MHTFSEAEGCARPVSNSRGYEVDVKGQRESTMTEHTISLVSPVWQSQQSMGEVSVVDVPYLTPVTIAHTIAGCRSQEAGVPIKLARSIGVSVDHRRRNRSLEGLQVNILAPFTRMTDLRPSRAYMLAFVANTCISVWSRGQGMVATQG